MIGYSSPMSVNRFGGKKKNWLKVNVLVTK